MTHPDSYYTQNKLYEYRKKNHLTRSDLADVVDVSEHTIYSWEVGKSNPHKSCIIKLANLFSVDPEELGLTPYTPRNYRENVEIEPVRQEELDGLFAEIDALGYDCLREIEAYLSPDPEHRILRKLRGGLVSDAELELIRRIIAKHRERGRG